MRKTHVLKPTGKRPYPDRVIVVQAKVRQRYLGDADDVGHMALTDWHAVYSDVVGERLAWDAECHGTDAASWWQWLEEETVGHKTIHIYSWQARECMAALGMWDAMADGTMTLKGADPYVRTSRLQAAEGRDHGYIVLEGPPTIVAFAKANTDRRMVWLDPQNYGVKSLHAYCDLVDNEGGSDDVLDGELWIEGSHIGTVAYAVCEWLECYYDSLIALNLGGPEHTAASQAMQAFRHHYMRDRIEIHDSADAIKLERAALYGGRCECRYIGSLSRGPRPGELCGMGVDADAARYNVGPLYYLDVNSLYPSIAANVAVPIKLQGVCGQTNVYDMLAAARTCGVIAAVDVATEKPVCPVRMDDRIIYPIGRFSTVLCGPELQLASMAGAKLKVRRMALYQAAPIYYDMVDKLYGARRKCRNDGNKRMEQVCKAVLNSAFGKWAQVKRKWEDVDDTLPLRPYMQWWQLDAAGKQQQYRSIGWNVQRMVVLPDESSDTFPAITAYINSYARCRLWELLCIAGLDDVYYYDTDSLICNAAAMGRLLAGHMIDNTDIGKLKVVATPDSVRIIGRQAYELDGTLTISGARGEVRRAGDSFVEILTAPPIGYYLTNCDPPGLERRIARVRVTRAYNLGHVGDDGSVRPVRFT